MLEALQIIFSRGRYGLRAIVGKILVARMICKTPELSDEKVKNITNMML